VITLEDAIKIHLILGEKYGGEVGIRDKGLLESFSIAPFPYF
jgi:hypothetical protein